MHQKGLFFGWRSQSLSKLQQQVNLDSITTCVFCVLETIFLTVKFIGRRKRAVQELPDVINICSLNNIKVIFVKEAINMLKTSLLALEAVFNLFIICYVYYTVLKKIRFLRG